VSRFKLVAGEIKRVFELDVYKLAEGLSDMVWRDFDWGIISSPFLTFSEPANIAYSDCNVFGIKIFY